MAVLLLQSGANPDIQSKSGMTALHATAFNNRDGLVQVLLSFNADPNLVDSKGRTPIMVAAQMGHTNPITHMAQAGANLEVRDVRGNTPLMLACGGRHLGAVDELLFEDGSSSSGVLRAIIVLLDDRCYFNGYVSLG